MMNNFEHYGDIQYWPFWEDPGVFTAWIALTDVFSNSGPVRYILGSNHWNEIKGVDFFNNDIVNSLRKLGSDATSFHTKSNNIIEVEPEREELGFVGIPKKINTRKYLTESYISNSNIMSCFHIVLNICSKFISSNSNCLFSNYTRKCYYRDLCRSTSYIYNYISYRL